MTTTTIQWASPLSIGLLLAAGIAALIGWAALRRLAGAPVGPARRRGLWVARGAILATLLAILLNPVRVAVTPGAIERARVAYLLDTSQSMALGETGATRWDTALATLRDAERGLKAEAAPRADAFRFGSRLAAVEGPFWRSPEPPAARPTGGGAAVAAEAARPAGPPPSPTEPDTLLAGSLETLAGRFGQAPPQAVVVLSDGRARDPERAGAIARGYANMKVPIHVVPLGDDRVGGDVAIVSMVAPGSVRKHSRVPAQVFVRSYGYKGRRAELRLAAAGPDGRPGPVLARTPVVLQDGLAGYTLSFESGDQDRRIAATVDVQPGEVSSDNNTFAADVDIDHTKIRVLYLEGATEQFVERRGLLGLGGTEVRGAYWSLQDALMEDPDIECTAVMPGGATGDYSQLVRTDERGRGMPATPSELFAYDAIILSNVPRESLSDKHLEWIDRWIARRGGGLCMAGGPNSFASGGWADTTVGRMLPVDPPPAGRDWIDGLVAARPITGGAIHPLWQIVADEARNRALLGTLPSFLGHNHLGPPKPTAEVLATFGDSASAGPAIAVQPYGRGRTMAVAPAITRRWASEFTQTWGEGDARYYRKFWRNAVYWLTENSSIGRRRLLAETDKRLYRPGEPIVLQARAYDENAASTVDYRVAVSIEPQSADITSDDSPLRRPAAGPAPEPGQGPLLAWGEEFDLTKLADDASYSATLPIAEARALPPEVTLSGGLRIELTAYEGNTQVDSTALEVQILDDPSEQQNPLPDHDLLQRIAKSSGGTVLRGSDALRAVLAGLPTRSGPPEIDRSPAWSRGWLLCVLIGLLTVEWVWRRRLGLA